MFFLFIGGLGLVREGERREEGRETLREGKGMIFTGCEVYGKCERSEMN